MPHKTLSLKGQRFGRLLVVSQETRRTFWLCACDCGRSVVVRGSYLKNGNTASCGCARVKTTTKPYVCRRHGNVVPYVCALPKRGANRLLRQCRECRKAESAKRRGSPRTTSTMERLKARERRVEVKRRLFFGYGDACSCCGERTPEFLSIDHVNGDGARRRRSGEDLGGETFYKRLIKEGFPGSYRLLCMNCNFAMGKYGYCPHEAILRLVGSS